MTLTPLLYKTLLLVFLFLFCRVLAFGQGKASSPETVKELQTAVEKVLKETGTPAAGVALVDGDSVVWVAGIGKADIETGANATENTMFRIGSTSKMFVALAILKLQEEGRVSLQDKVRDLVPEIKFKNPWSETHPILVEHLLEHTTGWDDLHLTEYALSDPSLSLKEGLDFHPHSRSSRWVPGTRMSYCNAGPAVAAYIVEKITGQKFEDYIQEQFFRPMGMEHMTFFASEAYKRLGATLYNDNEPQEYWHIGVRPSGSINASPKDMARMLAFFISRGQVDSIQLISEASLKRMETPSNSTGAKAGLEYGYGLANYSTPYKSFVYRSHHGGVNGGLTDFSYLPEYRVGYAIMINSGNGNTFYRIINLVRSFQTRHFAADSVSRGQEGQRQEDDIAGYYVAINPRIQMAYHFERIVNVKQIWSKHGFTFTDNLLGGETETHIAINNNQCIASETGKVSLVKVRDPLAGDVVHAGTQVLKRTSPFLVYGQLIFGIVWFLALIGSVIYGLVWLFRRYRKVGIPGGAYTSVRLWPFLASLFFLAVLVLGFVGIANPMELLGKVSFVSVAIMVLTICFALASVWAVITVIKERKARISEKLYWHAAILSGLHFIVTCYLLWHGIIGIQTWS